MAEKLIRLPQLQTFKQQADLKYQDKLTAGTNIAISGTTISATDTTYSDATTASDGLMSSTDKVKLNGIESGANNYTLPIASTGSLGGVKVGTNLSIDSNGVLSANSQVQPVFYATVLANNWSGTSNQVTVSGITSSDKIEIVGFDPTGLTSTQAANVWEALSYITYGATSTNKITFYALNGTVPNVNIPMILRKLV